jgi:hypothetical protein
MPLSRDPIKRKKQLGNLRPGAGAGDGGLQRARTHGFYAEITDAELEGPTRQVYDALAADAPVKEHGSLPAPDVLPVRWLAEAIVVIERLKDYRLRKGVEDEHGKPRSALELELRARGYALDLAKELGMTPAARAKLGLDLVRTMSAGDRYTAYLREHDADVNSEAVADD